MLPLPLGDEADADHPNTVRSVVMVGICWDDYTNIVYVGIYYMVIVYVGIILT